MTEYIIATSIGVVYPIFFTKLAQKITGIKNIKKNEFDCYDLNKNKKGELTYMDSPEYKACWNKWDIEYGKADFKLFIILLCVGLAGIIISGFIGKESGWATKIGIAVGGLITLLYAVIGWRHLYNEDVKIALLGIALVILVLLSARLYKANSLVDVITWDFN